MTPLPNDAAADIETLDRLKLTDEYPEKATALLELLKQYRRKGPSVSRD